MSGAAERLAKLKAELAKVEAAADRDWSKRTEGVPDRFLADLRAGHEQRWSQPRNLLREEIAKLSRMMAAG